MKLRQQTCKTAFKTPTKTPPWGSSIISILLSFKKGILYLVASNQQQFGIGFYLKVAIE
uniref:Uncharacterized protein n=1 Tax=Rhizophora mucronata TaxID=61149 RepID=A0A2P2P828_RHIMU